MRRAGFRANLSSNRPHPSVSMTFAGAGHRVDGQKYITDRTGRLQLRICRKLFCDARVKILEAAISRSRQRFEDRSHRERDVLRESIGVIKRTRQQVRIFNPGSRNRGERSSAWSRTL